MPELPEVECTRRGLEPLMVGRSLKQVILNRNHLRYPLPSTDRFPQPDDKIAAIGRRSKYLIIFFRSQRKIILHFGMSGRIQRSPTRDPIEKHAHVIMSLSGNMDDRRQLHLQYIDPRRFGSIDIFDRDLEEYSRFSQLGPEPLDESIDLVKELRARAKNRSLPLKNFLMDARNVVGIGNIYASEILFLSRLHPMSQAGAISTNQWERIVKNVRLVLQSAIDQGGSTLRDFCDVNGHSGGFQTSHLVYGRGKKNCVNCREIEILQSRIGGRSSFFCPNCQGLQLSQVEEL